MVVLSVVGAGHRPSIWVCEVHFARKSVRHARDYSPVAVVRGRSGRVVWVVCGGVRSTHRDFRNRKGVNPNLTRNNRPSSICMLMIFKPATPVVRRSAVAVVCAAATA